MSLHALYVSLSIHDFQGDWKISANVLDGKKVVAGVRLGKKNEWLNIETPTTGGNEAKFETYEPGTKKGPHDEF